jgi:hypothetical protein
MDNFLAGTLGYLLGRASAPAPAPAREWTPPPPVKQKRHKVVVAPLPTNEESLQQSWQPFDPLAPAHWARRPMDGVPTFPRFGRRWPNEHRAEYLYYLHPGDEVHFPQTTGADEPRSGPGWVLVRDDPGVGWVVALPCDAALLLQRLSAPVPAGKTARDVFPWLDYAPVPLPLDRLAPAGWYDHVPPFGDLLDPGVQYLNYPWVQTLGFDFNGGP